MSKYHSHLKRLKCFGNIIFVGIALTLFILNLIKYANDYLKRDNYVLFEESTNDFYIMKEMYSPNGSFWSLNCSSRYSKANAEGIFQWFIKSSTKENQIFHIFYWFMIITSFIISIIPSGIYVVNYSISNHYHIKERYCLSSINLFIRTFFSTTIFILPSFYMNTFDFSSAPCLNIYPAILSIDISPFIFITFICLIIYFLMNFILTFFYEKHRFCCSVECLSYVGLCILSLLIIGIILFSAAIIAYVWIVSFIEKPLQLPAILIIVQFPFLILQLLAD
jgi:hypothetical protein